MIIVLLSHVKYRGGIFARFFAPSERRAPLNSWRTTRWSSKVRRACRCAAPLHRPASTPRARSENGVVGLANPRHAGSLTGRRPVRTQALRDFPHQRFDCVVHKFPKDAPTKEACAVCCKNCYCCKCDSLAPMACDRVDLRGSRHSHRVDPPPLRMCSLSQTCATWLRASAQCGRRSTASPTGPSSGSTR